MEATYYHLVVLKDSVITIGKTNQGLIENRSIIETRQTVTGTGGNIRLYCILKEQGRVCLELFSLLSCYQDIVIS